MSVPPPPEPLPELSLDQLAELLSLIETPPGRNLAAVLILGALAAGAVGALGAVAWAYGRLTGMA